MKILIIGLGSIAQKHILAIKNSIIHAKIYALRHSKNSDNRQDIINIYNYDEINFIPAFIIISNPTSKHFSTIEKCLSFRVPLFIEKPLFSKLDNGYNLIKKIQKLNVKTYIACVLRFHPVIRFFKDYIKGSTNQINEVNVYCGSYLPEWRPGKDFRKNYSAVKGLGGGVHLDLIHEIDYVYYLFGKPIKVHKLLSSKSTLNIETTDYANYCLEYNTFNVSIILNYYRTDAKRTMEITYEDRTLLGDLINSTISDNIHGEIHKFPFNLQSLYDEQFLYFNTTEQPMNNISEAWEVLKIALDEES